jgi:hypothetical protein
MQNIEGQAKNKDFLLAIVKNNHELPDDIEPFLFSQALLENFSSPDAELRDELSYIILASSIIGKQKLTQGQLEALLTTALDNEHLFYHIGESGTDTVFMRSFSNLIIASILFNDTHHPQFAQSGIQLTKEKILHYAQEEKDWRGYVEGKGWAHAMAHLADALDECAQHPSMTSEDRQEILIMVSELALLAEPLYNEEDMRLATIPYHILLGHQVSDDFINQWIEMCTISRDPDMISWKRITNTKNMLRSLYFFLQWDNIMPLVTQRISTTLRKLDEIYLEKGADD